MPRFWDLGNYILVCGGLIAGTALAFFGVVEGLWSREKVVTENFRLINHSYDYC